MVTHLELGDGRADRLDLAGQLGAGNLPPRSEETGEEAADEVFGAAKTGIRPVDRRGVDLDEDFVILGYRALDLLESQNLRVILRACHVLAISTGSSCTIIGTQLDDNLTGPPRSHTRVSHQTHPFEM
jgi:hypothetical protein